MIWKLAKLSTYIGAIMVTVYAAMLGLLHIDPPRMLFNVAMVFVIVGVLLGNYVVFTGLKKRRNETEQR